MKLRAVYLALMLGLMAGCNLSDDEPALADPNANNSQEEEEEVCDECGVCDADPSNDCVQDCAGEWGGTATEDACGVCDADPDNDCVEDCAGELGGDATEDMCGVCDADPDNDCVQDCAGEWGGEAVTDMCGTCDADPDNDCVPDCNGDYGGTATTDICGRCVGGQTGLESCPTVTLTVVADAAVSQENLQTNYGTEATVQVDRQRSQTYLRFDLSSLPTDIVLKSARLRMVGTDYESFGGSGDVNFHFSSRDDWDETTINGENAPVFSDTILGSWNVDGSVAGEETTFELIDDPDVLDVLQGQVWGDKVATLVMTSPGYRSSYVSKEGDTTKAATLEIGYLELAKYELSPEADATVSASEPNKTLGTRETLEVGATSRNRSAAQTWVRFNLSFLPEDMVIERASFQMLAFDGYAWGGNGNVYTHIGDDDTWAEDSISYDTMPTYSTDTYGYWWLWYDGTQVKRWGTNSNPALIEPLTEALKGDKLISFFLQSSGYDTEYYSREAADAGTHPKLTLYYLP